MGGPTEASQGWVNHGVGLGNWIPSLHPRKAEAQVRFSRIQSCETPTFLSGQGGPAWRLVLGNAGNEMTHPPVEGQMGFREFPLSQYAGLEKAMATHSSTLAWKIPWTEEPGRLQSMGSHRIGHG